MPPMPSSAQQGMRGPTWFDKWKMGAMMGGSVGLIMGFIFGSYTIIRNGAGTAGPMRLLGQYMLGSATTFGFFMSIGSIIRTEGTSQSMQEAFARSQRRPMIMPRQYTRRPVSAS